MQKSKDYLNIDHARQLKTSEYFRGVYVFFVYFCFITFFHSKNILSVVLNKNVDGQKSYRQSNYGCYFSRISDDPNGCLILLILKDITG